MPHELRGTRYLTKANEALASAITDDLPYFDFDQTKAFYRAIVPKLDDRGRALLGVNDRYFLLTALCRRKDAIHPWLFNRCREVETEPDGYIDLWARYHYKSTIITFAGSIQEILIDPEITIAIFSHTKPIARAFLSQIMQEFERNEYLKKLYPDVLWDEPRKEAPVWGLERGIVVKRKSNPKESTIEAHGLVDGQPTSRHYGLHIYDDMVTKESVTNPEMIKKTTESWELADNLASHEGARKWMPGTRYCSIGSMRVLMADWSHRRIEDVRIGDTIVGWELRDGKRWLKPARVINRGIHFQQPVNRYTLEGGRSVVCTADHKWWRGPWGSGAEYQPLALPRAVEGRSNRICQPRGTTPKLHELLVPVEASNTREAAWLAGFFDGEGSVNKNKNHPSGVVCITQTMHNPELIDETRRVLHALKYDYRESWHSPSNVAKDQSKWADRCVFTINGGWRERYRFIAEVSPVRREKIASTLFGQLKTEKINLESVESAGLADVHWLETETGNYVVEGFCSSNSFADTYGVVLERRVLKARKYPATDDGTLKGTPVFLTQKRWAEVKDAQRSTVSAQMLQNPVAGNEAVFKSEWFRPYLIRPTLINVYIMVDPSKGRSATSDRTAMAVIGVDSAGNKYLLDGVRHRMKLSDRWEFLKRLYTKWRDATGVQVIIVGYERYGAQTEDEVIKDWQERDGVAFELVELNWPREGGHSKRDRVERLEPDMKVGKFFLPGIVYHGELGGRDGAALWMVWTEEKAKAAEAKGEPKIYDIGQIVYRPLLGEPNEHKAMAATAQHYRIVRPIKNYDEDRNLYDLTRAFMEEAMFFPFAPKDDLIDAASRIYDLSPRPALQYETGALEPGQYVDS